MGWNFNEEIDVVLIPTVTGEIFVPQNTLRFLYPSDSTIVQRGFRLYNRSVGLVASLPPSPWGYLRWKNNPENSWTNRWTNGTTRRRGHGEIGRRTGLKILRPQGRAGSTPAARTS